MVDLHTNGSLTPLAVKGLNLQFSILSDIKLKMVRWCLFSNANSPPPHDRCCHTLCSYFTNGRCHKGKNCCFVHDNEARAQALEAGGAPGGGGESNSSRAARDTA